MFLLELLPSVLSAGWINYLLINDEKEAEKTLKKNKIENTVSGLSVGLGITALVIVLFTYWD
ncbi:MULTISPECIES: hypothetical protein [Oceanobacillus]|uniref:hypothetical protein n=1 Tax=Oceanobacillus TaxID=182709 RepID=UPI000A46848B